jgi:hypothetical protein
MLRSARQPLAGSYLLPEAPVLPESQAELDTSLTNTQTIIHNDGTEHRRIELGGGIHLPKVPSACHPMMTAAV